MEPKHIFMHHGKAFTPDGIVQGLTSEEVARAINTEQDAKELAHWQTQPDTFAPAYYDFPDEQGPDRTSRPYRKAFYPGNRAAKVSTWHGTKLGDVVKAHVYAHNFGARMVSMVVRGTNGAQYHGRASWDGGQIIRLRKMK